MIIRGWSIDGFGVFSGASGPELGRGVNVILGPNEAGKSTLLSFVRHTLFGYPARNSKTDTFVPALKGGSPGGRLFLEDKTGGRWTVERFHGKKGVTLTGPSGEKLGEETLAELLGNLDGSAYRSVFGFDLSDLASLDAMTADKVKGRLTSAGISGAGDSAQRAIQVLESRQTSLLKDRGGARLNALADRLKTLLQERDRAVEQLSGYSELVARQAGDEAEASRLLAEIESKRTRADLLKSFIKWKPTAVRLAAAREELSGLATGLDFPENGIERLQSISERASGFRQRIAEIERSIADENSKLAAQASDPGWLSSAPSLAALDREAGGQKARLAELAIAEKESEDAAFALGQALDSLGTGWDLVRLSAFRHDGTRIPEAKRYARLFTEAQTRLQDASAYKSEAEAKLQALLATMPPSGGKPDYASGGAMVAFAIIAAILSFFFAKDAAIYGYGFSAALCAAGAYFLSRGGPRTGALRDGPELAQAKSDEARAQAKFRESYDARNALSAEWASYFDSWGAAIEPAPSPETAAELLERIDKARIEAALAQRAALKADAIRNAVDEFENRVQALLKETPAGAQNDRGLALLEALRSSAEKGAREEKKESDSANRRESLSRLGNDRLSLLEKVAAAEEEEKALLAECGAGTVDDFRQIAKKFAARLKVAGEIKTAEETLASQFGIAFKDKAEGAEFNSSGAEAWGVELAGLQTELLELSDRLSALNRAIGANAAKISDLEQSTEIGRIEGEIEAVRSSASHAAREWLVASLASGLVRGALDKFARERQPGVLAEGSRLFSLMTGGRYVRVIQPPGETSIRAERRDGSVCEVSALSRGTKEELYLAIRLGLASDFASRGADLPILADDIFVNFDPTRAEQAIAALCAFAGERQAVVFTCHPETVGRIARICPEARLFSLERESGIIAPLSA